ncbi:hypothetical protein J4230_03560 [Candidatus Woesearchaeota archaeon]|nr:hypothetical protein [Candidatus Woesearchaeota archaeon]
MAVSSYPNLVANLVAACPESELYDALVERSVEYFTAKARLGDARTREDPRILQFETDVAGRYRDLEAKISEVNLILGKHKSPMPLLPITQEGIDTLVGEIIGDLFQGRRK